MLVSLGLVGLGTLVGRRGPVYVGAIGLVLFLFIVGSTWTTTPEPDKLGVWPIVLIALGLLAVALGALKEASLGDRPSNFLVRVARPGAPGRRRRRPPLPGRPQLGRHRRGGRPRPPRSRSAPSAPSTGAGAAMAWSAKGFDHIYRRYVPLEICR